MSAGGGGRSRARGSSRQSRAGRAPTSGRGATGDRFAAIGAYGFRKVQVALLAALVTEDPLLLIGRAGTGKTYLLNSISEALGLEHRHYNASLIAFDDLVGFPWPDDAREGIRRHNDIRIDKQNDLPRRPGKEGVPRGGRSEIPIVPQHHIRILPRDLGAGIGAAVIDHEQFIIRET